MRQTIADMVPDARGADTADLELGIVGYLRIAKGDTHINYCEGGGGDAETGMAIRIGDCIKTTGNGRAQAVLNDRDDKYNSDPTIINISRNSEMCFDGLTVNRDVAKSGVLDLIQGAIRVITHGWRPGSSLGVDVSVKAAVTIASDVVLEYDPDLDLLRTYVNEGNVGVTHIDTGESVQLDDNQLLITHQDSIGESERMSNRVWNDLLEDQALDDDAYPEEDSERVGIPLAMIGILVCGSIGVIVAVAVFLILRQRKKVRGKMSNPDDSA